MASSSSSSSVGGGDSRPWWARTAVETVAALRRHEVSPFQLVEVAAARIGATDGDVNATPILCLERARERARALEAAAAATAPEHEEGRRGRLYGLPVLIKDMTPVEGVRFVRGCHAFREAIAPDSHPLVTRLEALGAVVLGKTNTPELGAGAQTFNPVFGATRNPWDTRLTPGGSSGGAAAALACGQAWLASGSDLGGSLRIPASFTGTVGLRPTPGRVAGAARPWLSKKGKGRKKKAFAHVASSLTSLPSVVGGVVGGGGGSQALTSSLSSAAGGGAGSGHGAIATAAVVVGAGGKGGRARQQEEGGEEEEDEGMLDPANAHLAGVDGPMARNVPDLALFLDALVPRRTAEERLLGGDSYLGIVESVVGSSNADGEGKAGARALQGVRRLAYSRDLGGVAFGVEEEVARICEGAVAWLEAQGGLFEVTHGACPDLRDGVATFDVLRAHSFATMYAGHALYRDRHQRRHTKPEVVWNIRRGTKDCLPRAAVARARDAHCALLGRCLAFFQGHDALLTPAVMLPPFDHRLRYPTRVGPQPLPAYTDWLRVSSVVTLTCGPALCLPCGMTASGLPVGLQIVGPPYSEAKLLALAAFFERHHPYHAMLPREPVAGTAPLVAWEGPRSEAEAAALCGLAEEYGETWQQQRAAL